MVTYSAETKKVRLFENSDKIFLFFSTIKFSQSDRLD